RPHRAGRHLRAGLPALRGRPAVWLDPAAEQDQAHRHHLETLMADVPALQSSLTGILGERIRKQSLDRGQLTLEVGAGDLSSVMKQLRDEPPLAFSIMVDLLGMDYSGFDNAWDGPRFAVVYNLLSIQHNHRVRVRVFCANDDFPSV